MLVVAVVVNVVPVVAVGDCGEPLAVLVAAGDSTLAVSFYSLLPEDSEGQRHTVDSRKTDTLDLEAGIKIEQVEPTNLTNAETAGPGRLFPGALTGQSSFIVKF